jgi:hypothetical protein
MNGEFPGLHFPQSGFHFPGSVPLLYAAQQQPVISTIAPPLLMNGTELILILIHSRCCSGEHHGGA